MLLRREWRAATDGQGGQGAQPEEGGEGQAWKVSLAGCIAWYSLPFARATRAANSRVRLGKTESKGDGGR